MAPPSALAIASGAVVRLRKEEISYRTEQAGQEVQVKALEDQMRSGGHGADDDGNAEFMLKQQVSARRADGTRRFPRGDVAFGLGRVADWLAQRTAIEQTKAIFAPLRKRIEEAIAKLEEQIDVGEGGNDVSAGDLEHARAVLKEAKTG